MLFEAGIEDDRRIPFSPFGHHWFIEKSGGDQVVGVCGSVGLKSKPHWVSRILTFERRGPALQTFTDRRGSALICTVFLFAR